MSWCFAMVNNRLAEIHFEKGNILGHCYIREEDYKNKKEKDWISEDTKLNKFVYRKGEYKDCNVVSKG